MSTNRIYLRMALPLVLGSALALGCSDDDDNDTSQGSDPSTSADASVVSTTRDGGVVSTSDGDSDDGDVTADASVRLTEPQVVGVAAATNAGEISAGTLAQSRATDPRVREYATMMVTMHTAAQQRQSALGVAPQASPQRADLETRNTAVEQALAATTPGAAFDLAYIQSQVDAHETARDQIDELLLPSATTPALQSELTTARTEVVMHLEQANDLLDSLSDQVAGDGGLSVDGPTILGDAGI